MANQSGKDLLPVVNDQDPQETREWQEALDNVIAHVGKERAHFLIQQMIEQAREEVKAQAAAMRQVHDDYLTTIADQYEDMLDWQWSQGDIAL